MQKVQIQFLFLVNGTFTPLLWPRTSLQAIVVRKAGPGDLQTAQERAQGLAYAGGLQGWDPCGGPEVPPQYSAEEKRLSAFEASYYSGT